MIFTDFVLQRARSRSPTGFANGQARLFSLQSFARNEVIVPSQLCSFRDIPQNHIGLLYTH